MNERNKIYQESLDAFLKATNEDILDPLAIIVQASEYAEKLLYKVEEKQPEIEILDIGSGNGRKSHTLAAWLGTPGIGPHQIGLGGTTHKIFTSEKTVPRVDAIEPKQEQRLVLEETYRNSHFLREVYPTTLAEAPLSRKYDLVLALHSLYEFLRNEDGTIATFEKAFQYIKDDGVGVIVKEHPESDIQRLKKDLSSVLQRPFPLTPQAVEKTLKKHNIFYKQGRSVYFNFPISLDQDSLSLGKQFDFLFSQKLDDQTLNERDYKEIAQWVRQNIRRKGEKTYLSTANTIYWWYPTG